MDIKDCFYFGKILKPFSFKGEIVIYMDVDNPDEYKELDGVYIEINKVLVLYPIEKIRINSNNTAVVRLQGVSFEDIDRLKNKSLYLPLELLPVLEGNKFYFHEVINFKVIDKEKGEIGYIKEVLEYAVQPIFSIENQGKEILIPVIDSVIEKVDRENNTIYINAPKGLIDLYLL
ncbi:MAG: ribosome maturation factor RimM [Bacteroidales bacterium]|jgi:16S rRNA processing protein RimM|nr:ribosome maturation factor RimM [Bacteroidales bacterium]